MQVEIAGYNVDKTLLDTLQHDYFYPSPDSLVAAYARISRDPAPIGELRQRALGNTQQTRKTVQKVFHELGHRSVGEHAVFNFDISDVSRLVIESIERHRLVSYTEKSQRFQKLDGGYITPKEIALKRNSVDFHLLYQDQKCAYDRICTILKGHSPKIPEGKIKEDARYVTGLAVGGQLGMTINARNLNLMIKRLLANPLNEAQELGTLLCTLGNEISHVLIPERHQKKSNKDYTISDLAHQLGLRLDTLRDRVDNVTVNSQPCVILHNGPTELSVVAALLYQHGEVCFDACWDELQLKPDCIHGLLTKIFQNIDDLETVSRAWELVNVTFELTLSASAFAQLKRHRIATIIPQRYNPALGFSVPPLLQEMSTTYPELLDIVSNIVARSNKLWERMGGLDEPVSDYALTQAHRRRVIFHMNLREAYAFCYLRRDKHAQWEIRELAHLMARELQKRYPVVTALMCGKDTYEETFLQWVENA